MRFMPGVMTLEETRRWSGGSKSIIARTGLGLGLEVRALRPFVGFLGLAARRVSRRRSRRGRDRVALSPAHWGKGYATEGAKPRFDSGSKILNFDQIVSFTVGGEQAVLVGGWSVSA